MQTADDPTAENEHLFWQLERALSWTDEFALYLLLCDSDDQRSQLTARLAERLAERDKRLAQVAVPPDCIDVLGYVEQRLSGGEGALSLTGVPEAGGGLAGLAHVFNQQREQWPLRLPLPVLMWLDQSAFEVLAVEAPDFLAWSRSVLTFGSQVQATEGRLLYASEILSTSDGESRQPLPATRAQLAGLEDLLRDLRAAEPTPHNRQALFRVASRVLSLQLDDGRYAEAVALGEEMRARAQSAGAGPWAARYEQLIGRAYALLPIGDRTANLGHAIEHCQSALRIFTEDEFPRDWATTQNYLANIYAELPTGDRAANLARAIEHCQSALRIFTEDGYPHAWATVHNDLATIYARLPTGDLAANLVLAVEHFQAGLRVITEDASPHAWATAQRNLAAAYTQLPTGDRAGNLARAIEHNHAALRVLTRAAFPQDWAAIQNNLATVLRLLPTGNHDANVGRAVEHYQAALDVYTEGAYPREWAATQHNLANAYQDLATGERAGSLARAIEHYHAALRVRSEDAVPLDWAGTQWNVGIALVGLDRFADAAECFAAAARGYDRIGLTDRAEEARALAEELSSPPVQPPITPATPGSTNAA